MVTRSPNHMCAISWVMTEARNSKNERGWRLRGRYSSRSVTQPAFSIAPGVVLGDVELVVLPERVGVVELLLEPLEALLGELDQLGGVHVLLERLAAVVAERDGAELALVGVELAVVLTGHDRGDVGRHPLGGGEAPGRRAALPVLGGLGLGRRGVGDHDPVRRGGDVEGEDGLQVGLLEGGEDAARVGHLELAVEVDPVVGRVDEAVQALAGVGVGAVGASRRACWSPRGRRA